MNADPRPQPRWNPWPVCIIAFFAVAITSSFSFVVFCNRHPADLVAADYYEQEVRYQGQIDRSQRAQQAAPAASAVYDPVSKVIRVSLGSRHETPLASGTIQLYRPSAMNRDVLLKLAPEADGVQIIDASKLLPGLWKVRVSWTVGQQGFFIDQKVIVGPMTASAAGVEK